MDGLPQIDYSRHPGYQFEPDHELGRRALEQLEPLIARLTEAEAYRAEHFGYRYGSSSEDGRRLVEAGALPFELSEASSRRLLELAEPAIAAVRARMSALKAEGKRANFLDRMEMATVEAHAPLRAAVEEAMREIGAFELTSAFFSARAAKLENAGLLISTPEDKESLLRHSGEAPGAGLHVDSSGKCLVKAVLYVSDVDAGSGPFGLVQGSHRWDPGCEERIWRRAFDRSELKGRAAGSRRAFISLPRHLQVKAEFGADLLPEWDDTRDLLASELVFLGRPGTGALFDPEAVHRGGLVAEGERRAILVTLSAVF
jgi:hypothetical protein